MKRVTYCFVLGAAALGFSLLNQLSTHAQGGGAGGAGAAGAGQSGTAGQMGSGQAGTSGQMGSGQAGTAGQMGTGQAGTAGQMGTGQTGTAGQARPGGPGNIFPPGNQGLQGPAGMQQGTGGQFQLHGSNPWFGNPQVQQQLRFNAGQNRQLNDAYNRAYSQFQQQTAGLNGGAEVNFRSNANTGTTGRTSRNATGTAGSGVGGAAGTGTTAAGTSADRRGPGGTTAGTGTTSGTAATGTGTGTFGTGTGPTGAGTGTAPTGTGTATGTTGSTTSSTTTAGGMTTGTNVGGATSAGNMTTGTNVGGATTAGGMATGTNVGGAATAGFDSNLTPQQRQQQLMEAERNFLSQFNRDAETIITDPVQRTRFNQLQNQYQGYDAFLDPTIRQRLNITDSQLSQITGFRNDWYNQMEALRNVTPAQRDAAMARYTALRRQTMDRINQTLTEPQRRMLSELYGPAFEFGMDVYFPKTPPQVNDFTTPGVGGTTQGTIPQGSGTVPQGSGKTSGSSTDPGAATRPGTSPTTLGSGLGTSANPGATTGTGTGRTDR